MARLTIHDADWRNGFVRVNKGKYAKDRVVPMGARAARSVRGYLEKVRRAWNESTPEEDALWLSSRRPHRRLKSRMIQVMVGQHARSVGIGRPITPHVWRHTCATDMVRNGANLVQVKQLLGHRSLRTTQVYVRVSVAEVLETHRRAHPRGRIACSL